MYFCCLNLGELYHKTFSFSSQIKQSDYILMSWAWLIPVCWSTGSLPNADRHGLETWCWDYRIFEQNGFKESILPFFVCLFVCFVLFFSSKRGVCSLPRKWKKSNFGLSVSVMGSIEKPHWNDSLLWSRWVRLSGNPKYPWCFSSRLSCSLGEPFR